MQKQFLLLTFVLAAATVVFGEGRGALEDLLNRGAAASDQDFPLLAAAPTPPETSDFNDSPAADVSSRDEN